LKQLKAKWYKKLRASGFVDQEDQYERLKTYSKVPEINEEKETYYQKAGQFLYDYDFEYKAHNRIWALHCEGLGRNKICKKLRKGLTPAKVRFILEKLGREFALYRYVSDPSD